MTFESEEPAEKVCSIQYHDIKGKKVEVKVAQTKEAIAMQQGRGRMMPQRNYGEGGSVRGAGGGRDEGAGISLVGMECNENNQGNPFQC